MSSRAGGRQTLTELCRATKDVDLLVPQMSCNMTRLLEALAELPTESQGTRRRDDRPKPFTICL